MVNVLLILFVFPVLAAVLFVLSRFLQRAIYEQVPESLWWRALAGAGILWAVGLVFPSLFNAASSLRWPVNLDDMFFLRAAPAQQTVFTELLVPDDSGRQVRYRRTTSPAGRVEFRDEQNRPMPGTPLEVIAVTQDGHQRRFQVVTDAQGYIDRRRGTAYYRDEQGREVPESALYTGEEQEGGYGQFFVTVVGDLLLFAAWFAVLWLVMLFQWPHALLLAVPAYFAWGLTMNLVA